MGIEGVGRKINLFRNFLLSMLWQKKKMFTQKLIWLLIITKQLTIRLLVRGQQSDLLKFGFYEKCNQCSQPTTDLLNFAVYDKNNRGKKKTMTCWCVLTAFFAFLSAWFMNLHSLCTFLYVLAGNTLSFFLFVLLRLSFHSACTLALRLRYLFSL